MTIKFQVNGMTCAACSARVEKVSRNVPGVQTAQVNLLAGTMVVTAGEDVSAQVIEAIRHAGYEASVQGEARQKKEAPQNDTTLGEMKKRIIGSAVFLAVLMAYLVYSSLTGPKKAIARWEENMHRSFGTSELHLCTEFYDRALAQTVAEDNSLMTEGYSAISQMKETEHLILLKHSSTQWFFLAKEGFQGGAAEVEKFRAFIAQKIGG